VPIRHIPRGRVPTVAHAQGKPARNSRTTERLLMPSQVNASRWTDEGLALARRQLGRSESRSEPPRRSEFGISGQRRH
jgi:hypothetical protein